MKATITKISPEEITTTEMNDIEAIQMMDEAGYKFTRAFDKEYKYQKWNRVLIYENGTSTFYYITLAD